MPTPENKKKGNSVVEQICIHLRKVHGLSAKQFFQQYMSSMEGSMVIRRKQWISPSGWKSTEDLLDSFKKLVNDENTAISRMDWNEWVLKQASFETVKSKIRAIDQ